MNHQQEREQTMAKKNAKKSKSTKKPQQLKIEGTGRLDANDAVEQQSEVVRKICEKRMDMELTERDERKRLTALLKDAGLVEYIYEDADGEKRRAYLPKADKEPQAKVQKVKSSAAAGDEE
jgi:hypothetical protein